MAQVLTANPHDNAAPFSSRPLSTSPPKTHSFFLNSPTYSLSGVSSPSIPDPHSTDIDMHSTRSSSAPSSPRQSNSSLSRTGSYQSTTPSSVSLSAYQSHAGDDDDDFLPNYGHGPYQSKQYATASVDESPLSASDLASSTTTDDDAPASPSFPHVADDTEAREEPSRHVDYLSHNWREEDIWSSWKHIVSRRREYGEMSRLENASWRTWAKAKNNLKTVSPERLNWLKDCDVTWLYGPLQQGGSSHGRPDTTSGLASCFSQSKNNSFINKKSNLKKRSVSEVMLQKSLSSSSLVKQAAAAVQAQRSSSCSNNDARPSLERGRSDFGPGAYRAKAASDYSTVLTSNCSSEVHSPEAQSRRHIRFDTNVEQCIAVEFKETAIEEEDVGHVSEHALGSASSSSEDDLPMMKTRARAATPRQNSQPSSSRNSFSNSGESKGIAKLPSTQIRFHADEAEQQQQQQQEQSASFFGLPSSWKAASNGTPPTLDKSPSQETLRPSKTSAHFFVDDPELDDVMQWPSGYAGDGGSPRANVKRSESASDLMTSSVETLKAGGDASQEEFKDGLRRTPSGMFMPFDENNDDENLANVGMFGRVVDTVNTARDIAHVIWNVGWRK